MKNPWILSFSRWLGFLIALSLLACACGPADVPVTSALIATTTSLPSPSAAATNTLPPQPSATFAPSPTATPAVLSVCSPLAEYNLSVLSAAVVNPYDPPALGKDEPHHGIDLAYLDPQSRIALSGWPVQAVLQGTVVGVIDNRFPYGNALIVETALEAGLPPWEIPALAPTPAAKSPLTCPDYPIPAAWQNGPTSLYLMYAHLQNPPVRQVGDAVTCGSSLGEIGMSGNALNPHLHLEMRVGPAGVRFPSLAHYDASASQEEMGAYCLWRISGWFQPLDPMMLFGLP